jgi:ferrous iron transport protein B
MGAQQPLLRDLAPQAAAQKKQVVVIGYESVGKSQLIASLTGRRPYIANYRGSTVSCECYSTNDLDFIDTPGILYRSDSETTRQALGQLRNADTVLIVVKGTKIGEDIAGLLPLVVGKNAAIVVTFSDKILNNPQIFRSLEALRRNTGLSVTWVDARDVPRARRDQILEMLLTPKLVDAKSAAISVEAPRIDSETWLESAILGRIVAVACLILPAVTAVMIANRFAEFVDPYVQAWAQPAIQELQDLPALLKAMVIGKYGLITMGPLMFVWALPTVVLYAVLLGAYKASGLLDLLTIAIDPMIRRIGLSGRDVVRVLMGFGCNVPAVINTRACSSCSRDTCISAIAFGSACSYQMGATLAVYSATGHEWLVAPYLLYLTTTTFIYVRLVSAGLARSSSNPIVLDRQVFLQVPSISAIWRESEVTLKHFLKKAMPIFVAITLIASALEWCGAIQSIASSLQPIMTIFNLPSEAILPVIMASIRKDGILLFGESNTATLLTADQVLTATYLAGVLLPCIVTAITITREKSSRFALQLMARQVCAAVVFSAILAWGSMAIQLMLNRAI